MKQRTLQFIDALRDAGIRASLSESLDAVDAIAHAGIHRQQLREALAATLIKDEADRATFDTLFDDYFRDRITVSRPRARRSTSASGDGGGRGDEGSGVARPSRELDSSRAMPLRDKPSQTARHSGLQREERRLGTAQRLAAAKILSRRRFQEMDAGEQEACAALAEAMSRLFRAHLKRRLRSHKHGRLDIRSTLRRSIGTGGVPIEPAFRRRRPGRIDLVVICDCSHSVATASRFLLSVVTPCRVYFRRLRLFGFIDRPVEVSIENGHFVPHEPLDLYARSDLGKTLTALAAGSSSVWSRNTLVLILGDARNNRRPARADLLARIAARTRNVVWLNPEPPSRWDTGDSAMCSYAPHCEMVIAAATPRTLVEALRRALL